MMKNSKIILLNIWNYIISYIIYGSYPWRSLNFMTLLGKKINIQVYKMWLSLARALSNGTMFSIIGNIRSQHEWETSQETEIYKIVRFISFDIFIILYELNLQFCPIHFYLSESLCQSKSICCVYYVLVIVLSARMKRNKIVYYQGVHRPI